MVADTPYQSPESNIINDGDLHQQKVRIFSVTQRIGRLRYLAYLLVCYFLLPFVMSLFSSLLIGLLSSFGLIGNSGFGSLLMFILYLPVVLVTFVITIRRLHDLDRTGWQSTLLLIPIINLIIIVALMLVPGDQQANRYGPPPGENTVFTWLAALIPLTLLLATIGFGYWAYQDYQQQTANHSTSD